MSKSDYLERINKNIKHDKEQYTKLLELDPVWLVNYLTDMVVNNEERFEEALNIKSKSLVMSTIEQWLY